MIQHKHTMNPSLEALLAEYNVATTALLAIYWKNVAKQKVEWPTLTQQQGGRDKDLFKDPIMPLFINDDIKVAAEARLNRMQWLPLATRTLYFRRIVSAGIKKDSITQVLILGSGFDTLAVRKKKYGVSFFEIDQAKLLQCKEAIYKQHGIDKNAWFAGIDYVKDNLLDALKSNPSLDCNKPTMILWEGNTFYLEKTDALRILRELSSYFSRLTITFDYMHATMKSDTGQLDNDANATSLQTTLQQFEANKSPFKTFFSPDEIVAICKELGMQCISHKTAAELAIDYDVDKEPYYTAKPYSVVAFRK